MTLFRDIDGIRYQLHQPADLRDSAAVQAAAFTSGTEPVMGALRVTLDQFSHFIHLLGPAIERDGLSIAARDVSSGRLVGSSIQLDMATPNPPEVLRLSWLQPALALLNDLDELYLQKYFGGRHPLPGESLHFCWGAVVPKFQGRGIDKTMVDIALELGVAKNYRTAVVEASSLASQHIFRKRGFAERAEIPYRSYVYGGKQPFDSVDAVPSIILFDQRMSA